jgi:hypothetical protein
VTTEIRRADQLHAIAMVNVKLERNATKMTMTIAKSVVAGKVIEEATIVPQPIGSARMVTDQTAIAQKVDVDRSASAAPRQDGKRISHVLEKSASESSAEFLCDWMMLPKVELLQVDHAVRSDLWGARGNAIYKHCLAGSTLMATTC